MEGQYVVFTLGSRKFGISINHIQEITEARKITPIPNSKSYIEGITSLRSNVIPVISMGKRLKIEDFDIAMQRRIIIVNHAGKKVGFTVEDASQVITLNQDQIEPAPEITGMETGGFIEALGKVGEDIVLLLKIDKIINE